MTRKTLLLAAVVAAAAATGCGGGGQAQAPATTLPAIQKSDPTPVSARESAGAMRSPQPPR